MRILSKKSRNYLPEADMRSEFVGHFEKDDGRDFVLTQSQNKFFNDGSLSPIKQIKNDR